MAYPVALSIGLVLSSASSGALAEESDPAEESPELARAREQFHEALARQTAGNWTEALRLFKAVAAVRSTPQVRFNIAVCQEKLGRLVAALGEYLLAAADARASGVENVEREASERAAELKHLIPKLTLRRGRGAETAEIRLDGTLLGDAALGKGIALDPGPHTISASAHGHQPFHGSVRLEEAEARTFVVVLEPEKVRPLRTEARRPEPRGASHLGALISASVGVLALTSSGVFYTLAARKQDDLERAGCNVQTGTCVASATGRPREELEAMIDERDEYTTLGHIGLGVGATGLVLGVTLFLARSGDQDLAVSPTAHGALLGSTVVGRF